MKTKQVIYKCNECGVEKVIKSWTNPDYSILSEGWITISSTPLRGLPLHHITPKHFCSETCAAKYLLSGE